MYCGEPRCSSPWPEAALLSCAACLLARATSRSAAQVTNGPPSLVQRIKFLFKEYYRCNLFIHQISLWGTIFQIIKCQQSYLDACVRNDSTCRQIISVDIHISYLAPWFLVMRALLEQVTVYFICALVHGNSSCIVLSAQVNDIHLHKAVL